MKLRWLRSPSGKLMGVAVLRSKVNVSYRSELPLGAKGKPCDGCGGFTPAMVFCTTCNQYLCEACLERHANVLGVKCNFISTAVARELFAQLEKMCK